MDGERVLEDRKFVEGLGATRAGRILQAHLASVSAHEEGRACESSVEDAITNERVLITSIARALGNDRPMPCGLPFPLPKFIAICNLSGEKLILYGSSPSLLRRLCTRSAVLPPREVAQSLIAFETWSGLHKAGVSQFVLISYCMPWQAGVGSAYWSVSCCDYSTDDRIIRDRMVAFTSRSNIPFNAKSVRDPTDMHVALVGQKFLPLVASKQIKDLSNTFCCSSLDVDERNADKDDPVRAPPTNNANEKKLAALEELVRGLERRTKKDQAEINRLKSESIDAESDMLKLVEQCEARIETVKKDAKGAMDEQADQYDTTKVKTQELLNLEKSQRDALTAELNALKASYEEKASEHTETKRELKKVRSKMEELRRQSAAKDQLGNAAASKYQMTIKVLEDGLEAAKGELRTLRQELEQKHRKETEERVVAHAKEVERLQASIGSKERIVNQLSEVSERRETEVEKVQDELRSLRAVDALRSSEVHEWSAKVNELKAELAQSKKELANPKVRSVSVSTRTSSTSTHNCATTQTNPVPPPPPSTPPPPLPKAPAAEKDADATQATVATPPTADNVSEDTSALCQSAEAAVQKLIAHVFSMEGQATSPSLPVAMMPAAAFHPQFLHPNHQMMFAQPQAMMPQFFQPPPQAQSQPQMLLQPPPQPLLQPQPQPQPQSHPHPQYARAPNGGRPPPHKHHAQTQRRIYCGQ